MINTPLVALLIILFLTLMSILFKWWAFNRVDAISIEISFFSLTYTIIRLALSSPNLAMFFENIKEYEWLIRIFVGTTCYIILSLVHHHYFTTLYSEIIQKIDREKLTASNKLKKDALENTKPLIRHAVFLSFSRFLGKFDIRSGKRRARRSFAQLLSRILSESRDIFKEEDFSLDIKTQIKGLALFFIFGLVSIVIAVLPNFH